MFEQFMKKEWEKSTELKREYKDYDSWLNRMDLEHWLDYGNNAMELEKAKGINEGLDRAIEQIKQNLN